MDVSDTIKARRSVREFKLDPISEEKIKLLLESARLVPSGTNKQPWRFIVVREMTRKQSNKRQRIIKGTLDVLP